LYNTGKGVEEIPFDEVRIDKNDIVSIKNSDLSDAPLIAKVDHIPV
jgi:hypothetical protein